MTRKVKVLLGVLIAVVVLMTAFLICILTGNADWFIRGAFMTGKIKVVLGVLIAVIVLMTAFIIYILTGNGDWIIQTSYLQSTDQIYCMEAGILYNELNFRDGGDYAIKYDFHNEEYPVLSEKYHIRETAGDGTESEKALALMNEYSGRLYHASDYDNHIDMNALSLLE